MSLNDSFTEHVSQLQRDRNIRLMAEAALREENEKNTGSSAQPQTPTLHEPLAVQDAPTNPTKGDEQAFTRFRSASQHQNGSVERQHRTEENSSSLMAVLQLTWWIIQFVVRGMQWITVKQMLLASVAVITMTIMGNVHPLLQLQGALCGIHGAVDTVLLCPAADDLSGNIAKINSHIELLIGRGRNLPMSHSIHAIRLVVNEARSEVLESSLIGKTGIAEKYSQLSNDLSEFEAHANQLAAQSSNSFNIISQEVDNALKELNHLSRRWLIVRLFVPDQASIAARYGQHARLLMQAMSDMEVPLNATLSSMKTIFGDWDLIRDERAEHSGFHREYGHELSRWQIWAAENQEWSHNKRTLSKIAELNAVAEGKTYNISIHLGPLMAEYPTLRDNLLPKEYEIFSHSIETLSRTLHRMNISLEGVQNTPIEGQR